MQRHSIIIGLVLLLLMISITGCNIFSWAGGDSANSLIADGNQLMRDGDCVGALEKFEQAIAEDTLFADARYFHAKAALCVAGINILQLGSMMTDSAIIEGEELPFSANEWDLLVNDLYYATNIVVRDLKPIFYGFTHGTIDSNTIDVEYVVSLGIRAALYFQDTNLDGVINGSDVALNVHYSSSLDRYVISNIDDYVAATPAVADRYAYFEELSNLLYETIQIVSTLNLPVAEEGGGLDTTELETILNDMYALSYYYKLLYTT